MISPVELGDHTGGIANLLQQSPKQLQGVLEARILEQHEADVVKSIRDRSWAAEDTEKPLMEEHGLDFQAVRSALKSKKVNGRS